MLLVRVIFLGVIGAFFGLWTGGAISVVFFWAGGEEAMGPALMMIFAGTATGVIVGVIAGMKMK
jgi:hypothetical protein